MRKTNVVNSLSSPINVKFSKPKVMSKIDKSEVMIET